MSNIKEFFSNNYKYFLIFGVGGALGFGLTFFLPAKTEIKIIKEGKTESVKKIVVEKNDNEQLWKCYDSDIEIEGRIINNNMLIVAQDTCKKSTKNFQLSCKSSKKNSLIFAYSPIFNKNFKLGHMGSVSIFRDLFGSFSIGVGVNFQHLEEIIFGASIGIMYKF